MALILICDDERNLRELLAMSLTDQGHRVQTAENGSKAMRLLEENPCDLVITDLKLPDLSGLEILRHAKRLLSDRPVLLMTAYASTETAVTAMKEGAFEYLEKPFRMEDFHLIVTRALEQGELQRENLQLRQALQDQKAVSGIIGQSQAMRRILDLVQRVARTSTTVLITGESGTGKEVIAQAIHQQSPRANRPFVAINCAAIPETLIESELFGHVKGAFSGAISSRKGVFLEACGGTILLDEISEMPTNTQAKLLRVLQERCVRPVGGSGERPVDVRVIATTNTNPQQEVAEGRFREDLYYRINVVNLHLPPLRERREDIPLLANRFIENSAKRHGLPARYLDPQALDCLLQYAFPGNVRELENILEGAVSLTDGVRLEVANLPAHVRMPATCPVGPQVTFQLPEEGIHLEGLLHDVESQLIHQALQRSDGNKTRAAELLGLSFRSFRYRLSKLGIGE